ncbi:MAG: immune inhibitor A, partial [Thermoplasmata archaeon]
VGIGENIFFNATITNFGACEQFDVPVNISVRNITNEIVFENTTFVSLEGGASTEISWNTTLTTRGNHTIYVSTNLFADQNSANDAASATVIVDPWLRFFDDMESGSGLWTHNGAGDVWAWGTPAYSSGPANTPSGTRCWGTNLAGDYSYSMNANLVISGISLSNASFATLKFKHWYRFENNYDGGVVQISLDGSTWLNIEPEGGYPHNSMYSTFQNAVGSPSCYCPSSSGWLNATFDLTPYIGNQVSIRFKAVSDSSVNYAGWYIDDVLVIAGFVNDDLGVNYISSPQVVSPAQAFVVSANISNFGLNAQYNFAVKCEIINSSGVQFSNTTVVPLLLSHENITLSWSAAFDNEGIYIISVATMLLLDQQPGNDLKTRTVYIGSPISIPFSFDLEGSIANWQTNGTGIWQHGIPNYSSGPSSAHSGLKCWGTNLTGEYPSYANATLTTPLINLTGHEGHFAFLKFYHWYYFENNYDGGVVKISTDFGNSWEVIYPEDYYPANNMYSSFSSATGSISAYSGISGGWLEAKFNITQYLGNVTMFRFHMASDVSGEEAGWYIDDISIEIIIPPPFAVIDTPNTGFSAMEDTLIEFAGHAYGGSGIYVAYEWCSDIDGLLSNQASFSISNLSYGNHYITFRVMDTNNIWSANATILVMISATPPIANIISVTPNPGNTNTEITFIGSGTDPKGRIISQYYWRSDVDGGLSNYREFVHTFTSPGTRTIYFRVMNSAGAWSPEVSIVLVINLNNPPLITNTSPSKYFQMFENSSITLSADVIDIDAGQTLTLRWYKNGLLLGSSSNNFTFFADYDSAGLYNFTLEALDDFDVVRYSWEITVINVNRPPVIVQYNPPGFVIYLDENISKNFVVNANDPDGDMLNATWILDGKVVSQTFNYLYTPGYEDAGNHEILVTVSDGYLYAEKRWNVVVQDINRPPVVTYSIPEVLNLKIIEGDNITFYIEGYDPDGKEIGINWTINEIIVAHGNTYSFTTAWDSAGVYAITAVLNDGVKTTSRTWFVNVEDKNRAPYAVIFSPTNTKRYVTNEQISFNSDGSFDDDGDELSYVWYDGDSILSLESSFARSLSAGIHVIKLNVSDGKGGFAETQTTIFVRSISLMVTEIIFGTPKPIAGKNIQISAIISNSGDTDADLVDVVFYVDGIIISTTQNSTTVPAKGNTTVNFNWTAVKGVHTIRIEIRDGDSTNDLDNVLRVSTGQQNPQTTPGFELIFMLISFYLVISLKFRRRYTKI